MKMKKHPMQKRMLSASILVMLLVSLFGLLLIERASKAQAAGSTVQVWLSSADGQTYKLSPQSSLQFGSIDGSGANIVTVDESQVYQKIAGFGSTFTDSDIYNLSRLSAQNQTTALQDLFDPTLGIGWNQMRITLGSSDWNRDSNYYTYDENGGVADPTLANFSIQKDIDNDHIAIIKQTLQINPNVRIFASVWRMPSWMLTGNSFNSTYTTIYAAYLTKAIQAYQAQGIPIYTLSVANEPYSYCSMVCVSWQQERDIIKQLRADLNQANISTLIWSLDDQFADGQTDAVPILADSSANPAVAAVGFHDYSGSVTAMTTLHNQYPNVPVLVSEKLRTSISDMDIIIQYLRNWAVSLNHWTTMSDDYGGPYQWGSGSQNNSPCVYPPPSSQTQACETFLSTTRVNPDNWGVRTSYYLFGQFSKFIQRGAERIASPYGSTSVVTTVAFRNPDGSIILIAVNQTSSAHSFTIQNDQAQVNVSLPADTVGTYRWTPSDLATASVSTSVQGTGDNQLYYSGAGWKQSSCSGCYLGSNNWDETVNDTATMTFTGTRVDLYGVTDQIHGIAGVSIDGGTETMVDLYSPTRVEDQLVWSSGALANSHHTVTIRVTGNKNNSSQAAVVAIDRLDIFQTNSVTVDDSIHGTGTNQWNYQGSGWKQSSSSGCYNNTNTWDVTANDTASFVFSGTKIAFYGVIDTMHGIGAVSIDGGTETLIDFYGAQRSCNVLLWISPSLSAGTHTLRIRVTGTHDAQSTAAVVALDRIDVFP